MLQVVHAKAVGCALVSSVRAVINLLECTFLPESSSRPKICLNNNKKGFESVVESSFLEARHILQLTRSSAFVPDFSN